jgi:anti-sigma B factor antagonist
VETEKIYRDGKLILCVAGRIDTRTAPKLQEEIDAEMDSLEEEKISLELDLSGVDYLSSAGLRTVLYTHKRIGDIDGAKFTISNVNSEVMDIFEMTGFTEFLNILK